MRDIIELVGLAAVAAGVYLNWGIGTSVLVVGVVLLSISLYSRVVSPSKSKFKREGTP